MTKLKICLIAAICGLILIVSCKKDDKSTESTPKVSNQKTAETFAWGVKSSVQSVAPYSENQTWSDVKVSGGVSGSAVVNGSFIYSYNAYSGRSDKTYNNVVIKFSNYCDDSYYPHLTGTVIIDGTCTTQYGWSTTYSGQWELLGEDLQLSGNLSGTASIAMILKKSGLDWAAIVETAGGTWNMAY